ncbi:MAG: NERD domain-containing protein [Candidatus Lokiarchaeota archaeon]|nr:NERD domain-containing protein [Candidatus Lokiarchaeota archaeon]
MLNTISESSIKDFFNEIYRILGETDTNLTEIWYEISNFPFLINFNNYELREFLNNFEFISIRKGNYINYVVINKISFIIESINFLRFDINNLAGIIDYGGFESLVLEILSKNNYISIKNFRFSDKSNFKSKTSQKKYEIDVIGIYDKFILFIDAKQWKRKDSYSSISKAANLQCRRAVALKKNPEILSKLIQNLLGNRINWKSRLPFLIIPVMVTLEDNSIKINSNQIPIVSIYELNSFLLELQNNLQYFKTVRINKVNIQKTLF